MLKELICPVRFKLLIPLILSICISCVLGGLRVTRFLFLVTASLANFSCRVIGSDHLLLDKHDALALITCLAGFHDRDNDLLLVNLLVKTRVLEDLGPVDTFVSLLS